MLKETEDNATKKFLAEKVEKATWFQKRLKKEMIP